MQWERYKRRQEEKRQEAIILVASQVLTGVGMGLVYAAGKILETYKEKK